jgi:uncharacterized protein (TIGR00730 family)
MFKRIRFCYRSFLSLFKVMFQLFYGIWRIGSIPRPMVSIFGGSRLKQSDYYAHQANTLAQRLVDNDLSVLTGGGPGIMEAANCGAIYSKRGIGRSIGIGVRDLKEARNICVQEYLELDYFFARKWLLTRYSSAFVVFPGGFGTIDELSEVLTLMQTSSLPRVPIVLVGGEYWKPFMQWITDEAQRHGLIDSSELAFFTVTDDLDKVFDIIHTYCLTLAMVP